jgi:biopolymer transport protein ExbB
MSAFQMLRDAGVVGSFILLVGIGTLAIILERSHAYFMKYKMDENEFFQKIKALLLKGQYEEAISVCKENETKPLAKSFRKIIEKADQSDDAIFQAHDIALSENIPLYHQRLHYLSMLANVATLLGLLGTIHGLILSFQAVAQADPSMKQALLAQGISVSMYTTALGLAVAIPAMIGYSLLMSKQTHLVDQMSEKSAKLVEILTGVHTEGFQKEQVYSMQPPAAHMRTQ